ncbi:Ubiquitin-conjugating enzyme E2 2 [Linum perenne]
MLRDPNPNSPANLEAARMFSENKCEYNIESVRSSSRAGLLIKSFITALCDSKLNLCMETVEEDGIFNSYFPFIVEVESACS